MTAHLRPVGQRQPWATVTKHRDPIPHGCLRCGSVDYEPSRRTRLCPDCRASIDREKAAERMRRLRMDRVRDRAAQVGAAELARQGLERFLVDLLPFAVVDDELCDWWLDLGEPERARLIGARDAQESAHVASVDRARAAQTPAGQARLRRINGVA